MRIIANSIYAMMGALGATCLAAMAFPYLNLSHFLLFFFLLWLGFYLLATWASAPRIPPYASPHPTERNHIPVYRWGKIQYYIDRETMKRLEEGGEE